MIPVPVTWGLRQTPTLVVSTVQTLRLPFEMGCDLPTLEKSSAAQQGSASRSHNFCYLRFLATLPLPFRDFARLSIFLHNVVKCITYTFVCWLIGTTIMPEANVTLPGILLVFKDYLPERCLLHTTNHAADRCSHSQSHEYPCSAISGDRVYPTLLLSMFVAQVRARAIAVTPSFQHEFASCSGMPLSP
jgi:hypothetical protein